MRSAEIERRAAAKNVFRGFCFALPRRFAVLY
jgi:hypothetical protein